MTSSHLSLLIAVLRWKMRAEEFYLAHKPLSHGDFYINGPDTSHTSGKCSSRISPAFLVTCAMLFSTDFLPRGKQGRSLTSNQNYSSGVEICLLRNLNPFTVSFAFNEVKADSM